MVKDTAHRPYPAPRRLWAGAQRWNDLLMVHWPIAPDVIRQAVPPQLELDTLDGTAWLGIISFKVTRNHIRFLPPLPGIAAFPQINVRTYVRYGDIPGVYFFSLDTSNGLIASVA